MRDDRTGTHSANPPQSANLRGSDLTSTVHYTNLIALRNALYAPPVPFSFLTDVL